MRADSLMRRGAGRSRSFRRLIAGVIAASVVIVGLVGCSSGEDSSATAATVVELASVSITTFAAEGGSYLEAVKADALFEERDGCLYVGGDQAVWFFGTTARRKLGARSYEVFDAEGRKLAETGTTVHWGGGQVSVASKEAGSFADTLIISTSCKQRSDSYWIVGKIQTPLFETSN